MCYCYFKVSLKIVNEIILGFLWSAKDNSIYWNLYSVLILFLQFCILYETTNNFSIEFPELNPFALIIYWWYMKLNWQPSSKKYCFRVIKKGNLFIELHIYSWNEILNFSIIFWKIWNFMESVCVYFYLEKDFSRSAKQEILRILCKRKFPYEIYHELLVGIYVEQICILTENCIHKEEKA